MCKNAKFGAQLGSSVGTILEYDVQLDEQAWGLALRMHSN